MIVKDEKVDRETGIEGKSMKIDLGKERRLPPSSGVVFKRCRA